MGNGSQYVQIPTTRRSNRRVQIAVPWLRGAPRAPPRPRDHTKRGCRGSSGGYRGCQKLRKNMEQLRQLSISWWYDIINIRIYIYIYIYIHIYIDIHNMSFECVWKFGIPSTCGHLVWIMIHNDEPVDLGGNHFSDIHGGWFPYPPGHSWLGKYVAWKRKWSVKMDVDTWFSSKLDWNLGCPIVWKPIPETFRTGSRSGMKHFWGCHQRPQWLTGDHQTWSF